MKDIHSIAQKAALKKISYLDENLIWILFFLSYRERIFLYKNLYNISVHKLKYVKFSMVHLLFKQFDYDKKLPELKYLWTVLTR